ncbi:hypothetical protein CJZ71_02045 [Bacillus subtilis]|uniref:hypothetical protein n=1 Tax=Bacillus subtilis TaxID=1423 RepID=UPI000853D5AA|nr:hypothetical protein [Bacillus subtilis]AOS68353.1 hypothetical protein A4A60_12105 [Bacillus subtilis]ARW31991.1 hypothetical protein S101441_02443 [Bacillus subtilis subsp. subtilis]ASV01064.1 hypothetical protein CJZ71_02045 [Bacillus subtilis]AYK71077.1 hypothetical protein D9C09_15715 [Bacillus subtilis subsp. subtilis]AYK74765.1 hypothetical protein D9C12_13515 [Bacillus subtilis subsp. subtilis]
MGALFLHLKPDEYLKKLYKTKKLVEKTSFSLQAEPLSKGLFIFQEHGLPDRAFTLLLAGHMC